MSKPRAQDHEYESTAAPKSIEQDRKIVPFRKKAVTFMFHASYGTQIETSCSKEHVHMARIDDIIYDDQESDAALTHVPKGRDALLRTALSEHTIDPRSIIAAFDSDGQPLLNSHWIMRKNLDLMTEDNVNPRSRSLLSTSSSTLTRASPTTGTTSINLNKSDPARPRKDGIRQIMMRKA